MSVRVGDVRRMRISNNVVVVCDIIDTAVMVENVVTGTRTVVTKSLLGGKL